MRLYKTVLISVLAGISAVSLLTVRASDGTRPRATRPEGQMLLSFRHHTGHPLQRDSVLVIFDRTDRSGAGIIHGAFAIDSNHCVLIKSIPPGHYFVMIRCLGFHHDYWETRTWVRPKKCGILKIVLERCEEFIPGQAYIPPFRPASLTITTIRASGGERQRKSRPVY